MLNMLVQSENILIKTIVSAALLYENLFAWERRGKNTDVLSGFLFEKWLVHICDIIYHVLWTLFPK